MTESPPPARAEFPTNPVLLQLRRGSSIESEHRGAWVYADGSGEVIDGAGEWGLPYYLRSSIKALQALPLIESGAAEQFGYTDRELAITIASHSAEKQHTELVEGLLDRLGLSVGHLRCGSQRPGDPLVRARQRVAGVKPTALHNNCSGKHTGFLALAKYLDAPLESYLDPEAPGQQLVRQTLTEMMDVEVPATCIAVDGCSAPTFRLPLSGLAVAYARLSTPEQLAPERREACDWMLRSVAAHPELIAGNNKQLCTEIARVTGGRLFPKIGAEAVYAVGVRGANRGLAIKLSDGDLHRLPPLVIGLLERLGLLSKAELEALHPLRQVPLLNWAGRVVGQMEVVG